MNKLFLLISLITLPFLTNGQEIIDDSNKGMMYSAEFCFGAGVGNVRIDNSILDANYERTYGLKFWAAYKFVSNLAVGGTAIYDYYSDSGFLLLGPDVRYFTSSADFSPFVSANLGYALSIDDENRSGGFYYYPSAGVKIDIDRDVDLLLSLGFKEQFFSEESTEIIDIDGLQTTIQKTDDYQVGFLVISAGVVF
jgi:hypothetical protein